MAKSISSLAFLAFFPLFAEAHITIQAVGDIYLGGRGQALLNQYGYSYPFARVAPIFKETDVNIGNLEGAITERGEPFKKQFVLRMKPPVAQALRDAGFSLFSLANNHTLDYGTEGLEDTIFYLTQNSLGFAGAGMNLKEARRPAWLHVQGSTIAFLSYSLTFPRGFYAAAEKPGTAFAKKEMVHKDIKKAKAQAAFVIVSFHWGAELMEKPKPYQKQMAHLAVASGADLILGHHPHVLQGIEIYKGKLIFYSLGNFAFSSWSKKTRESVIARIQIDDGGIKKAWVIPLNVNNNEVHLQPQPLTGEQGLRVVQKIKSLSAGLGTKIVWENNLGEIQIIK